MKNKILYFWLNIISIMSAFFLGYFFEKNEHIKYINKISNQRYSIDIKKTSTKLEITNPYNNIDIKLNWEIIDWTGTILK